MLCVGLASSGRYIDPGRTGGWLSQTVRNSLDGLQCIETILTSHRIVDLARHVFLVLLIALVDSMSACRKGATGVYTGNWVAR